MTSHLTPENPEYWANMIESLQPKPEIDIRDYMISEAGLIRFIESGGPVLVRKADGTVVIEEGE